MNVGVFRWAVIAPAMLLALAVGSGCTGDGGAGAQTDRETAAGAVRIALATSVNATTYRLRNATFQLAGPESMVLSSEEDVDAEFLSASLPAGAYTLTLVDGWTLERQAGTGYQALDATLVSEAVRAVTVTAASTTTVRYRFRVNGGTSEEGIVNIGIEVEDSTQDAGADAAPEADAAADGGGSPELGTLQVTVLGDSFGGAAYGEIVALYEDNQVLGCHGGGGDCTEALPVGTQLTLLLFRAPGAEVTWGGACAGAQSIECVVTVSAPQTNVTVELTDVGRALTLHMVAELGFVNARVYSDPPGIDCTWIAPEWGSGQGYTTSCSARFLGTEPVRLYYMIGDATRFGGWDTPYTIELGPSVGVTWEWEFPLAAELPTIPVYAHFVALQ